MGSSVTEKGVNMTEPVTEKTAMIVVGTGAAGITAALDLARSGREVHLVEREYTLGGQVLSLDKLYPTDHCAFCPLWTEVRNCVLHPLVTIHTASEVQQVKASGGLLTVSVRRKPHYIDQARCILCGRCVPVCPQDAVHPGPEHAYPQAYFIDADACDGCGACVETCPTSAVDLSLKTEDITLEAGGVVWATGFEDHDLSSFEEFGYGAHPDILSSLQFEDLIAEAGANKGLVLKKSTGSPPASVAFIQCAGARDTRIFSYCSAVCCMHALKQAQWVKRRSPETGCTIFFTDMRTEGRHYYDYYLKHTKESALELVRARPGLIHPMPDGSGIAIKYEDTLTRKRLIRVFDMVVLNGALRPSLASGNTRFSPGTDSQGLLSGLCGRMYACGFCKEPMDVESSAVQASSAAVRACMEETPDDK